MKILFRTFSSNSYHGPLVGGKRFPALETRKKNNPCFSPQEKIKELFTPILSSSLPKENINLFDVSKDLNTSKDFKKDLKHNKFNEGKESISKTNLLIHLDNIKRSKDFKRTLLIISNLIKSGGKVMFLSTHPKYKNLVQQLSNYCAQSSITNKWIGGSLTNADSLRTSSYSFALCFQDTKNFVESSNTNAPEVLFASTFQPLKSKTHDSLEIKEIIKDNEVLSKTLVSKINLKQTFPDLIIIIDPVESQMAIQEANKLNLPMISFSTKINSINFQSGKSALEPLKKPLNLVETINTSLFTSIIPANYNNFPLLYEILCLIAHTVKKSSNFRHNK